MKYAFFLDGIYDSLCASGHTAAPSFFFFIKIDGIQKIGKTNSVVHLRRFSPETI